MKQKNISVLGLIYVNELFLEKDDHVVLEEMAFDEKNIKKLIESTAYRSAQYYNALKYIH